MNRHGRLGPGDFKSPVSTYFTTRAELLWKNRYPHAEKVGGATRSRTGLNGFAIRSITALLSRHVRGCAFYRKSFGPPRVIFTFSANTAAANHLIQNAILNPVDVGCGSWAKLRAGRPPWTTRSGARRRKAPSAPPFASPGSAPG